MDFLVLSARIFLDQTAANLNHRGESVEDSLQHNNILILINNNSDSKSSGQFNARKKQQGGK